MHVRGLSRVMLKVLSTLFMMHSFMNMPIHLGGGQTELVALSTIYEAVHKTGTPSARHVMRPSTRADTA